MDALILAGGKSSRMNGKHKGGLFIDDKKFIEILVEEMSEVAEHILLSYGSEVHELPEKCESVMDIYKDCGAMGGIHAGLMTCQGKDICVAACDMPFMRAEFYDFLKKNMTDDYDAIIPTVEGRMHPLAAIYKKRTLSVVEEQLVSADYKLRRMLEKLNVKYIEIKDAKLQEMLQNINTLAEYEALRNGKEIIDKPC